MKQFLVIGSTILVGNQKLMCVLLPTVAQMTRTKKAMTAYCTTINVTLDIYLRIE